MREKGEFGELIDFLKKKKNGLAEKLEKLYKNNIDFFHQIGIECPNCGKDSPMSLWVFIQEARRVYPGVSFEDVRWVDIEVEMCHMICPNCGGEIGIYRHPQKNEIISSIQLFGKEDLFKEIIKRNKPIL